MRDRLVLAMLLALAACGPSLPPPNSAQAQFDPAAHAVKVMISGMQPASAAALVAPDGTRYPASGMALVSQPHVLYNPPPSIGLGIGGFGWSGWHSGGGGFGDVGLGFPLGGPRPAEISDQFVASALVPVPPDYPVNWRNYRLEVQVGSQTMAIAAPSPA